MRLFAPLGRLPWDGKELGCGAWPECGFKLSVSEKALSAQEPGRLAGDLIAQVGAGDGSQKYRPLPQSGRAPRG
jgi:hypothetical protein